MTDRPPFGEAAENKPQPPATEARLLEMLGGSPIIPLAKINEPETFEPMADGAIAAAPEGTVPSIEILYRDQSAIEEGNKAAKRVKGQHNDEVNMFAGSIVCAEDVDLAYAAGFDGLISGGLSLPVAKRAAELGMPYLPAVHTLEELIYAHEELGLTALKLFPAKGTADQQKADAAVLAPLARLRSKGITLFASDSEDVSDGAIVANTATEVLTLVEDGMTEIQVIATNSEPEWDAIMSYAAENGISLCCTGGVKLANLQEFASQPAVAAVGASSILASANAHGGGDDLAAGVEHAIREMHSKWVKNNVEPVATPDPGQP